ncbi:hypothetical protein FHR59_003810 [Xanthomonas arboricola]|nr:hypothetical protein [Xanthomonas arboricola]
MFACAVLLHVKNRQPGLPRQPAGGHHGNAQARATWPWISLLVRVDHRARVATLACPRHRRSAACAC